MSLAVHWAAFKVQIEDNELKTYKNNNKLNKRMSKGEEARPTAACLLYASLNSQAMFIFQWLRTSLSASINAIARKRFMGANYLRPFTATAIATFR